MTATGPLEIAIFHCGALHYLRAFWDRFAAELARQYPGRPLRRTIISTYDNEAGFRKEGYDAVIHYPYGKSFDIEAAPAEFFDRVNARRFDVLAYYCDKQLPLPQSNLVAFIQRFEARQFVAFNTQTHGAYAPAALQALLAEADPRPTENAPWPRAVALCTADTCTADCVFCCLKTQGVQPRERLLDFDDFVKYYPPLLEKVAHIDFSLGELFVHPRAGDFLDFVFANYPGKKVSVYSNAIGFTPEHIERVLRAEQDFEIDISLNATSRETYRKVMGVDAFEQALEHIATFCRRREELGVRHSKRIALSYLINNHTLEEFPRILDIVERHGIDGVIPRIMKIYSRDAYGESVFFNQQRYNAVMCAVEADCARRGLSFSKAPLFGGRPRLAPLSRDQGRRIRCDSPWSMVYVRTSGDVSLCANWNFHIGSLFERDFADIWNGPEARSVREAVVRGDNPRECWACEVNLAEDDWIDALAYHFVWGFQQHLSDIALDPAYGYDRKGDFLA